MKIIKIYEDSDIDNLWRQYLGDHFNFYKRGDERSSVPSWKVMKPAHMTKDAQHYFDELKVKSVEIESAASTYQFSQRKDDNETLAKNEVEYYNLITIQG